MASAPRSSGAPSAPPPTRVGDRTVVAPDVTAISARLHFDVASQVATARADVTFTMPVEGYPALDLRQAVDEVIIDGRPLPPEAWAPTDLGGGPDATMRVLDVACDTARHELSVAYRLSTPGAEGAVPVGWGEGNVRFDLWMSDLMPGRYLEMWIPAPLCHDRFALTVDVEVTGTEEPHVLLTNTGGPPTVGRRWHAAYPGSFTSLSPMLVLAAVSDVELRRRSVTLPGRAHPLELVVARHREVDADLGAVEGDIAAWLPYLHTRYGPWAHGPRMTAVCWEPGRGMEYDGATTASVGALEHEVFHSWFGRGIKPARASDGWIDEAITTWATSSRRGEGPRFDERPLDPDADPMVLCPPHPWSRYTPRDSYAGGARVFAGVAHLLGGADRLRSAMADFYTAHRGGLVGTDDLQQHLQALTGDALAPLWERFVHGRTL